MKTTIHNMGLLEFLAAKTGCMYISDLHNTAYQCMIGHIIHQMDADAFLLSEWNDAVAYITGESKQFTDKTQAARYLENYDCHSVKKNRI